MLPCSELSSLLFSVTGKPVLARVMPAKLPTLRQTRPFLRQPVERKLIVVADDKIVLQIPSGKGTRLFEIERIRRIAQ